MVVVSGNLKPLFSIITHAQLRDLRGAFIGDRPHPLSSLLGDLRTPSKAAVNTGIAARWVLDEDPAWIEQLKPRLLDRTDAANAASALAELRAYGALLETGLKVRPGKPKGKGKPKPEFIVTLAGGREAVIEVHAKQVDGAMQAELDQRRERINAEVEEFRKDLKAKGKTHGVYGAEPVVIAPFGKPDPGKPGDTIVTNAISRLCAIKQKEHQLREDAVNILWLDLQVDYPWKLGLEETDTVPFASFGGMLTSGALWYALYGWKGAPVLEPGDRLGSPQRITPMGHDGRFTAAPKVSAVIAAFPRAIVLLENPDGAEKLDNPFRRRLLYLPWADAGHSICDWEPGLAAATIATQKRAIEAVAAAYAQTPAPLAESVGILAYGSLTDDPGEEIFRAMTGAKDVAHTPFGVEFARKSRQRGGAPTLVPVDEGRPVTAHILVVDMTEKEATDALYRREIHKPGGSKSYEEPPPGNKDRVRIERVENFEGVDVVLYAALPRNIEPTPQLLARLAIESVGKTKPGKDGITYLIDARRNGVSTLLSNSYAAEILSQTGTASLEEALATLRSVNPPSSEK